MRAALICLIGLPGAGKSAICSQLAQLLPDCFIVHLEYDRLVPVRTDNSWKSDRLELLSCIRQFLLGLPAKPTPIATEFQQLVEKFNVDDPIVFLLDDNMYLRSMRYSAYQLARECGIGFGQIYIPTSLATCLTRNHQRSADQRVSEDVIRRMAQLIEPPDSSDWKWESNSVSYADCNVERLIQLIQDALDNPVKPLETVDVQVAEESRRINRENLIQRADQICRKLISSKVAHSDNKSAAAKKLSMLKASVLSQLRQLSFLSVDIVEDLIQRHFED